MNTPTLAQPIHIIAPFDPDGKGGVWWHALGIYDQLVKKAQVELWSEINPSTDLASYPIRTIRPFRGEMPREGTFIFVGMLKFPGSWYDHAQPAGIVLECTVFAPAKLYRTLNRLSLSGRRLVEVGYSSELIRRLCSVPGNINKPIHGLEPFFQVEKSSTTSTFTIGKVSRNTLLKHHFRDISLYRKLAESNFSLNIVGGECLAPYVAEHIERLQLLPEMARKDLPAFLSGLDCFFYRTPLHCPESFGLVILEAMAAGLPVVVHRQGGYRDLIIEGENGFLFDTDDEAYEYFRRMKSNSSLVQRMGRSAREIAWQFHQAHDYV